MDANTEGCCQDYKDIAVLITVYLVTLPIFINPEWTATLTPDYPSALYQLKWSSLFVLSPQQYMCVLYLSLFLGRVSAPLKPTPALLLPRRFLMNIFPPVL